MMLSELAYEQFKTLPDPQAKEVLDFIGFLKERQERVEWEDLMKAQAQSLSSLWEDSGDEVWNDL